MQTVVTFSTDYQPWLCCDSGKDLPRRPALEGVYLDPRGLLVASNGKMLVAVPCTLERPLPHGVILPADFLRQVHKAQTRESMLVAFQVDLEKGTADGVVGTSMSTITLIDAKYLDYWRIIPTDYSELGPSAWPPAEQVLTVCKAMGAAKEPRPALYQGRPSSQVLEKEGYNPSPIVVVLPSSRALGIISPYTCGKRGTTSREDAEQWPDKFRAQYTQTPSEEGAAFVGIIPEEKRSAENSMPEEEESVNDEVKRLCFEAFDGAQGATPYGPSGLPVNMPKLEGGAFEYAEKLSEAILAQEEEEEFHLVLSIDE